MSPLDIPTDDELRPVPEGADDRALYREQMRVADLSDRVERAETEIMAAWPDDPDLDPTEPTTQERKRGLRIGSSAVAPIPEGLAPGSVEQLNALLTQLQERCELARAAEY